MDLRELNDSITVPMESVNASKKASWKAFGKYEVMNIIHGLITIAKVAAVLYLLHQFEVEILGFAF
jgi:hypothetical protein